MHATVRSITCICAVLFVAGCAGGAMQTSALPGERTTASAGAVRATPAFFDGHLVTISIIPLSPTASAQVLAKNKNVNKIFEAPGFIPVIDEIQGPGFNPLWQVVDIAFNAGHPAHQFTSAGAILAAQTAGEVSLTFTNIVVTVPVTGSAGK